MTNRNTSTDDSVSLRICRMCDLAAHLDVDVDAYADRLYALMRADERADEALLRERLAVCEGCEKRADSTCLSCGCYTLIRAMKKDNACPLKKWK